MSTREHKEMFYMGNFLFQVVFCYHCLLILLLNMSVRRFKFGIDEK